MAVARIQSSPYHVQSLPYQSLATMSRLMERAGSVRHRNVFPVHEGFGGRYLIWFSLTTWQTGEELGVNGALPGEYSHSRSFSGVSDRFKESGVLCLVFLLFCFCLGCACHSVLIVLLSSSQQGRSRGEDATVLGEVGDCTMRGTEEVQKQAEMLE